MRVIVFSDIHANLTAFDAVIGDIKKRYAPDAYINLGDLIDYGMRSNEVIERIQQIEYPMLANIRGNHEKAVIDGSLDNFSSDRGKKMFLYTKKQLSDNSISYITNVMQEPFQVLEINGYKILLVHGDIEDNYWGKITIDNISNVKYKEYDFVLSGHIHQSYKIDYYYKVVNPLMRNLRKTTFINPGSVGQPRNQNPCAQYAYIDFFTGEVHFNAVQYDIEVEQKLYTEDIDIFYKERLRYGI